MNVSRRTLTIFAVLLAFSTGFFWGIVPLDGGQQFHPPGLDTGGEYEPSEPAKTLTFRDVTITDKSLNRTENISVHFVAKNPHNQNASTSLKYEVLNLNSGYLVDSGSIQTELEPKQSVERTATLTRASSVGKYKITIRKAWDSGQFHTSQSHSLFKNITVSWDQPDIVNESGECTATAWNMSSSWRPTTITTYSEGCDGGKHVVIERPNSTTICQPGAVECEQTPPYPGEILDNQTVPNGSESG